MLQEGYWPNLEVLNAIHRMHRLMMAESLPGTRVAEILQLRASRASSPDIDSELTPKGRFPFVLPAHLGEAGAPTQSRR